MPITYPFNFKMKRIVKYSFDKIGHETYTVVHRGNQLIVSIDSRANCSLEIIALGFYLYLVIAFRWGVNNTRSGSCRCLPSLLYGLDSLDA